MTKRNRIRTPEQKARNKERRELVRANRTLQEIERDREKTRERNRQWYEKNRERALAYAKQYERANLEANPELTRAKARAKQLRRRQNNLEKFRTLERERARRLRANNPGQYKAYARKFRAKVMRENPQFRLRVQLAILLVSKLRRQRAKKTVGTIKLTGCDIDWLSAWLEIQFLPGMTWENYGIHGWHIDHIRPCASFDLTDSKQQKLCFHWTNLQPLWASENCSKSSKWKEAA
jgi:hypothetical protein